MVEVIADLPYRVTDATGAEYYVSVAAEPRADGHWEAWLEYVPIDDSDALLTQVETTQSIRADVVRWADALTETYVQGAFDRAVAATTGTRLVARRANVEPVPDVAPAPVPGGLPDPFELYSLLGDAGTRVQLRPLSRATLLAIIDAFGLNPAGNSLAWLTQPQLVTFIVTAVDVQVASGKRTM